jgi:hypothetical protein
VLNQYNLHDYFILFYLYFLISSDFEICRYFFLLITLVAVATTSAAFCSSSFITRGAVDFPSIARLVLVAAAVGGWAGGPYFPPGLKIK